MDLQLPVDAVEGVGNQINWEHLKRVWGKLVQTVGSTDQNMESGSFGFSWPGGVTTLSFVVTHNLGKVPSSIQITAHSGGSSGGGFIASVNNALTTATQMTIVVIDPFGAPPAGGDAVFWTVIG